MGISEHERMVQREIEGALMPTQMHHLETGKDGKEALKCLDMGQRHSRAQGAMGLLLCVVIGFLEPQSQQHLNNSCPGALSWAQRCGFCHLQAV